MKSLVFKALICFSVALAGCSSPPSHDDAEKGAKSETPKAAEKATPNAGFAPEDVSKLYGVWTLVKLGGKSPAGEDPATLEILNDGKYKSSFQRKGKSHTIEGTYRFDGSKLTLVAKIKDKERDPEFKIKTLTADTLVGLTTRNGKDIEMEFSKKKPTSKE